MEKRLLENPLEPLIGYQLRRTSVAAMGTLARELAIHGVSATEGSILLLIGANPGITQSEIGRILAIKRANMTPLAAGLARAGLIEREPVDGRSHGLVLSERGRDVAADVSAAMQRHDAALVQGLSDAMQKQLVDALRRIQHEHPYSNGNPT